MANVLDVANCFLSLAEFEDKNGLGDLMTDLKLQKMLYFAQGWHLARHNHALFDDRIEAWPHGPVVPNVFSLYHRYGSSPLHAQEIAPDALTIPEVETISDVFEHYGKYSASWLRKLSHEKGTPWQRVYEPGARNREIPIQLMRDYFSSQEGLETFQQRLRRKAAAGEIEIIRPKKDADGIAILSAAEREDWGDWDDA